MWKRIKLYIKHILLFELPKCLCLLSMLLLFEYIPENYFLIGPLEIWAGLPIVFLPFILLIMHSNIIEVHAFEGKYDDLEEFIKDRSE